MFIKKVNQINIRFLSLIFFSFFRLLPVNCQQLKVVSGIKEYRSMISDDSLRKMVELHTLIPSIRYDLRYATIHNFTGEKLYRDSAMTFMRLQAADALKEIQQALSAKGLGLKIFDAYRPYSATVKMWKLVKDERYVANPAKGSGHNRGLAVDLTIIKLATHEELNMGTGFDNFTDTAHHDFTALPEEILQNRLLLKNYMTRYGFRSLDTEWWHYYWPNDRGYEVLNIDFRKLARESGK